MNQSDRELFSVYGLVLIFVGLLLVVVGLVRLWKGV